MSHSEKYEFVNRDSGTVIRTLLTSISAEV
jgi:hypothetical protein